MGTWSKPGWPNGVGSPLSRSVATSTSLRLSCLKSLVRPGAENCRRSCTSIIRLEKMPAGSARLSRSTAASSERRLTKYCHDASAASMGMDTMRRAISLQAGRTSSEGLNTSWEAPTFSMNDAQISRGVSPLARPATMNPPADTPT
jgi:hypothetical protein